MEIQIRDATADDLPRLLEIYNHYVEHTHVTFDVEPLSLEERRRWLEGFAIQGPHRLFVAEEGGVLAGYASSSTFRVKPAYARSVETSIYLAPESAGRGVGTLLYAALLEALDADADVHRAYGGVAIPNDASIALHRGLGFAPVGTFAEVGFKFGRYWDVSWFERAC